MGHGALAPGVRSLLDTDDVVQDALFSTLRNLDHFEPKHDGALIAYLREAVANRIRSELRRTALPTTAHVELDALPSDLPSPVEHAVGREGLARYEAALAQLDETDRAAFIGRFELGYSFEALARVLARPHGGRRTQADGTLASAAGGRDPSA